MERLNNNTEIQNQHRNIELTDAETLKNLIEKVGLEKLNIALNELSNADIKEIFYRLKNIKLSLIHI